MQAIIEMLYISVPSNHSVIWCDW